MANVLFPGDAPRAPPNVPLGHRNVTSSNHPFLATEPAQVDASALARRNMHRRADTNDMLAGPNGDSAAQRQVIGRDTAIEHLGHLPHFLADGEIAHAHLAKRAVHVGEEFVDQGLPERLLLTLEPVKHEKGMQRNHVKAPVKRVCHTPVGIEDRVPRGSHNCFVTASLGSG
jgi:hypothetical protein